MALNGGARVGAGRKKGVPNHATSEVKALAQAYTEAALKVLASIMKDKGAGEAARVSAANSLLDRAHGRARQSLDMDATVQTSVSVIERVVVHPPN